MPELAHQPGQRQGDDKNAGHTAHGNLAFPRGDAPLATMTGGHRPFPHSATGAAELGTWINNLFPV